MSINSNIEIKFKMKKKDTLQIIDGEILYQNMNITKIIKIFWCSDTQLNRHEFKWFNFKLFDRFIMFLMFLFVNLWFSFLYLCWAFDETFRVFIGNFLRWATSARCLIDFMNFYTRIQYLVFFLILIMDGKSYAKPSF